LAKTRRATRPPSSSRPRQPRRPPRKTRPGRPEPAGPIQPAARSRTYSEAIALYQKGLEALQRRDFQAAADHLREVLQRFPDERELHERVRLYLRVCERVLGPQPPGPRTPEELVYAATVALNDGDDARAFSLLGRASEAAPDNGHVQYMLAAVHARRGHREDAIVHLKRAVELDADHRTLARNDSDFDGLRGLDGFRGAVEAPAAARRRGRTRPAR